MKRIIIMVAIIEAGVFLFAQESPKAGKIREIDLAKKEILVSYEQVGKPYKMGDKLHLIINDESVTLEVIFPMQTVARCKLAAKDSLKFDMLKKGMLVYIGAKAPDEYPAGTTKTIGGIEMVFCPSGSFMMGAVDNNDADYNEKPRHKVTLDGFWIGKYEVTQELYKLITGKYPSYFIRKPNNPVERISWYDAIEFCNLLSVKVGLNPHYQIDKKSMDPVNTSNRDQLKWIVTEIEGSDGFRLPTEAEWEYACRAESEMFYYWGDSMDDNYTWYKQNSGGSTHPVGTKKPNKWGLYDMIGNVWEWCWDWFEEEYYATSPERNPRGADGGDKRVLRGGSWNDFDEHSRISYRFSFPSDTRVNNTNGFRIVCPVKK